MPYSLPELVGLAETAGFQGDQAKTMAAIAYAESSGDPYAVNYSDPGGSYGLTQVNAAAHGPSAVATLGNPLEAFQQAYTISGGGTNFTPWSTYNSGAYLPHLAQLGANPPAGNASSSSSANSGSGAPAGGLSPLSKIFGAIGDLFARFGFMVLGALLVIVGAWYLAKPARE